MLYHYKAFNLHFTTPFECPELIEIDENNDLEKVVIEYGKTPENLDEVINETVTFQSNNKEHLLKLKTVGTYHISNGKKIVIEKKDGVSEDSIRLFLFGSAIGALLLQRGYLVLHASAINTPKGAVLFCGDSGAGKSTTLQAFLKKGYKKLSDDTIALYYEKEKKVFCLPSYPQSKLWQNSLDILDYENKNLRKVNEEIEKFVKPTKEFFYDGVSVPIYKLFVLNTHKKDEVILNNIKGLDKFTVIKEQTYRKKFIDKLEYRKEYMKLLTLVSNQIEVFSLFRPTLENSLEKVVNKIEEIIK